MTQQEFTERTGYTPATDEEYQAIEKMYMAAGNMDKDEFCEHWVKVHNDDLFRTIYCDMKKMKRQNDFLRDKVDKSADMILQEAENSDTHDTLDAIAIRLKGQQYVVRYKIEHEHVLTEEDRLYLLSIL